MTQLLHYFSQWNTILIVLALFSFIAMAIFFERLIILRRSEIDTNQFVLSLKTAIGSQNLVEGLRLCEEVGGSVANIVHSGLLKHDRPKDEILSSMELSGRCEIARLEKNARFLSVIAHIAPLTGLLGTVLGFIRAFSEMRLSGLMDISTSRVGEAMEYALVTTAAGLVVAIPCILAYNYLVSRIRHIVLEMQTVSSEIVDLLVYEA